MNAGVTATDTSDNTDSGSATVTVVDVTDPSLTAPANVTVNANALCLGSATLTATATDNCSVAGITGNGTATYQLGGPHTVDFTATDTSNNTHSGSATVTVIDVTDPSPVATIQEPRA